MSTSVPELRHGVVDGLETYWTGGHPARTRATLFFRAGMVDETHATHGIAHLAEHLYHGELTYPGALETNASTGTLLTSFDFRGPRDDVAAALTGLVERINAGVVEEGSLQERDILRAEAQQRGSDPLIETLYLRWGLRPVAGVADRDELFLDDPDPEQLRRFAARHYVRGNAILVVEGEPFDLAVGLPPGDHIPVPPLPDGASGEAVAREALTVSGLITAGSEVLEVACPVLEWSLTQRLRGQLGRSYGVAAISVPVAPGRRVLAAAGEVVRWDAEVWEGVLATLDELAERGPESRLVDAICSRREEELRDPLNAFRRARAAAAERLTGETGATAHHGAPGTVNAHELVSVFQQLRTTLLVGCPDPSVTVPRLQVRTMVEPPRSSTLRWRTPMWPANRRQFVVDDEGFGLYDDTSHFGMRWADVVEVHDDRNGMLTFYDVRGDGMVVNPNVWQRGDALVAELRRHAVALQGVARRELDSPPLAVPERVYPYDRLMAHVYGKSRWRWPILLSLWSIFAAIVAGCCYLAIVGRLAPHLAGVLIGAFVAVPVAGYFQDRRRVRKLTRTPR